MQSSTQYKNEIKLKLLNRKIEIQNEIKESYIKNDIQAGAELYQAQLELATC